MFKKLDLIRSIFRFDPFHPKPHSIMRVMTHLSAERIQKSNVKCLWKVETVTDRSEPTLKIELNEGDSLLFKTANLQVHGHYLLLRFEYWF